MIKEQEAGEKTLTYVVGTGSVQRRSTNTNRSTAAWSRLMRSGCELWKTRTASLKNCWRSRCWTTQCCETSIQKNGDARWEAESCGAFDGCSSGESAAGV
ncbi:UNVERIFIED_CONTAM: hypothetical protein GTU68_040757 [Idotea baltica]|nr:hypothetical protein [Idotea baltica]